MGRRNSDDMPRYHHIDLDHQAVAMVRSLVHTAAALVAVNCSSDIMPEDTVVNTAISADQVHSTAVGSVRKIVTEDLNSAHIAVVSATGNRTLDIMPVAMVASTAALVDVGRCTAVASDRSVTIEVHSSVRIAVASVTDNRPLDIKPVGMAVCMATSIDMVRPRGIVLLPTVHNADISSHLVMVGLSWVHETAIAARNLAVT